MINSMMRPPGAYTDGLRQLATDCLPVSGTMVEVGSYLGESTLIFLERTPHVICVDPHENRYSMDTVNHPSHGHQMEDVYAEFKRRVLDKHPSVQHIRRPSSSAASRVFDPVDLVYIDGDHSEDAVYQDILLWLPRVKHGGWLAGHDWNNHPTVNSAFEMVFRRPPDKIYPDTSWAIKIMHNQGIE